MTKILVAYASKHNSTAKIAAFIAEQLQQSESFQIDLRSVRLVESVSPYDAVILGSAIYAGQWQIDAEKFLLKYEAELTQRPTWLFSSGPTGEGDPKILMRGWELPERLRPIAKRIKPRAVVVFGGKLESTDLNVVVRFIVKWINSPAFHFGDFRDWHAIEAWTISIAQALKNDALELVR